MTGATMGTGETTDPASTRPAGIARGASLRDYWTDGSIAGLCASITELGGVRVELRDELGRVLRVDSEGGEQDHPEETPPGAEAFPIVVDDEVIGSVVVLPEGDETTRGRVLAAAEIVATATREMCADVADLRHRVEEIGVLYRLSALLVRGGRAKETLTASLHAALDVLGLTAGSIMLLPEDADGLAKGESEQDLVRSVAAGLSAEWLDTELPLSRSREFDRLSLGGEIVVSEDLLDDERVLVPEQCEREGLRAFMSAGMVFDRHPIGLIRVYDKRPRVFSKAERHLLRSIAQSAAAAVEQGRLLKLQARERRTQRALRIAGAVQQRMLPVSVPRVSPIDLAARYRPSFEIGGDFYDLFESHGRLAIVVGDVVGKGIAAGLLMSAVRATMRAYAELSDDLGRLMERTNDALVRDTTVSEFATTWMGSVDPGSLELRYVSAGHDRPALFRRGSTGWEESALDTGGMVAGVIPGQAYPLERVQLQKGDVLVAYTDGITDAMNFAGARFGRRRLVETVIEMLRTAPDADAHAVVERVFWSLRQFCGLARQSDDETLVVARIE